MQLIPNTVFYSILSSITLKPDEEYYQKLSKILGIKTINKLVTLDTSLCHALRTVDKYDNDDWKYSVYATQSEILQEGIFSDLSHSCKLYNTCDSNCFSLYALLIVDEYETVSDPEGFDFIGYELFDFQFGISCINNIDPCLITAHNDMKMFNEFGLISTINSAKTIFNKLINNHSEIEHLQSMVIVKIWKFKN